MSPRRGQQPTERRKQTKRRHGAPGAAFFCACKPIFRLARSYFFLFQIFYTGRIADSEDFRLGIRVDKRIEGVIEALLFQLLALESLFLRCDRRKWSRFPDWTPEERISLWISESSFFEKQDRLSPHRGPQSVFPTFIELFLFYYFYLISIAPPGTRFVSRFCEVCIVYIRGFYLWSTRDVSFDTRFWSLFSYRNQLIYEANVSILPSKNDEKTGNKI